MLFVWSRQKLAVCGIVFNRLDALPITKDIYVHMWLHDVKGLAYVLRTFELALRHVRTLQVVCVFSVKRYEMFWGKLILRFGHAGHIPFRCQQCTAVNAWISSWHCRWNRKRCICWRRWYWWNRNFVGLLSASGLWDDKKHGWWNRDEVRE